MHHLELASEFESDIRDTANWGMKWLVVFNAGKTQPDLFDQSKTLVLLVWKWMGLFLRKNLLLRCWGWLSLLNWIGAVTLSLLLKLPPRKLEPWFVLWSFFLLRLLCISINLPYAHVWNTVVMSGLVLPVATWNCWISYRNGYAELLVLNLLPVLNHWLIVKSLFYRHYFGRCSSELAQLVPFLYSLFKGGLLVILIDCMIFLSPFLDVSRMYMSTVSFLTQLGSGILLPIECFPLIYDLSGFNSRIKKHLLTVTSF